MKKYKIIIISLGVLLVLIFAVGFYYNYQISRMTSKSEEVVVTIPSGSITSIGETLKQNKLIRNVFIFKLYTKLNHKNNLKAGTYKFNRNMNLKKLVDSLEKGSSYNPDQISITFKEGLNVRNSLVGDGKTTKGAYRELIELIPNLTQEEKAAFETNIKQAEKILRKANKVECVEYFDKKRDLMLGSAPTDVLTALAGLTASGIAIGVADTKQERI